MRSAATFLTCGITALVILVVYAPTSDAYPQYSLNRDATYCRACHGDFRAGSYISLSDGQDWGNLHNLHRSTMLNGDCDTCHSSPSRFPVITGSSDGGVGLEAVSCVGCHGRTEDMGHDSLSPGRGAGLRQHHFSAGITLCAACHVDANPAKYTPVGEDVPPSYYFTPDAAHPDKPTDPCSPNGEEDYAGLAEGLDNDGDGVYDGDDTDCAPIPGDCDGDGDLDLWDHECFFNCLTGPQGGLLPDCEPFDFDFDNDVDLLDFAEFGLNFTG